MKTISITHGLSVNVSDEDAERVSAHRWHAHFCRGSGPYARTTINGRKVLLHRFVVDAQSGTVVDHIDFDGLNCQRSNLRTTTQASNNQHRRTGARKGVDKTASGRWRARITVNGATKTLGHFVTIDEAVNAYNEAAARLHGEFAVMSGDRS